jgi:phosphopantothenoylcysteine decarboxylase/phosphopantothenate--cysteine ligase
VELQKTPDIIKSVSESPQRPTIVVGFAAESHDVLANAEGKLKAKGLDLIVANSLLEPGSGFGTDTNRVTVLGTDGFRSDLPLMSKYAVAVAVLG